MFASAFLANTAQGAIRRIQRVSGTSITGTGAATWAQPTKPKNLLVAIINVNDANDTITAPAGSGWTLAIRSNATGRTGVAIYYWAAAPAQAGTSTWTIAAGCCLSNVVTLIEYAGAKLSSPLDQTGTWSIASGSNTSVSVTTSGATSQADEIAIAAWTNDGSKTYGSWTNSFNELVDTKPADEPELGVADKVLTSAASVTAGVTLSAAQDAVAGAIATFKAETSTTRYWMCSIQSSFDDNTCWTSTNGSSSNDVPAPDISGTMTAIFNGTGVGDAVIRSDPNLLSLQINSGYTGTVRQMTGGTQGLVGEWYDGTNFDTYKGTYIDGPISFSQGSSWDTVYGGPRTGSTDGNTFSVRWTGQVYAPVSGSYTFRAYTDDGVRLTVNGTQVINNWTDKAVSESVGSSITLTAGTWYDITMDYYDSAGFATCELRWTHPSQGSSVMVPAAYLRTKGSTGVQTDWYDGINSINSTASASNFKYRSLSPNVEVYNSNDWDDQIAGMITDSYNGETFSTVWQGQVLAAYSEAYTFSVFTDDGVRLWVNGQLVIDSWVGQYATLTGSPTIAMTAGQWYDIRLEYYENCCGGEEQLKYQSTSQALTAIPATAMRSAAALTLGSFTQAAGSFVGGTGRMDVNGTFSATGGAFTAPAQLTVSGAMTTSGCTFTHNSGRVILESTSSVAFNPGAANTYNDLFVNDGLIGYWNFDETSVTSTSSAADFSGYGNSAYHINSPTSSSTTASLAFRNDRALQFAMGTRHALRTPLTPDLQVTTDMTAAFWYRASQGDTGGADVISAGDNWSVRLTATQVEFYHRTGGAWQSCTATKTTFDNAWHHVAVTHSATYGTTLFFDGLWANACSGASDTTAITYDQGRELWIGRHGNGGTAYDFDGYLDDVRVYNVSLLGSEISALANGYPDAYARGTYTLGSNLTLAADLYLNSGTLDVSSAPYNVVVGDDWLNMGGRFTARTGTVTLSGSSTYLQPANEPFYNLSQTGGSYTQLGGRMTIDGTVAVSSGTIDTWGFYTRVGNITDSGSGRYYAAGWCALVPRGNITPVLNSGGWVGAATIEVPDEPNLVRFYRFDDLHGRSARDDSGNASTGTLQQGASWITGVSSSISYSNWGAMRFDGSDDYVQFTAPAATKVTLSAWIYPSNSGDSFYRIVDMPAYKLYISRAGGGSDNAMALQFQMVTANGTYVYQSAANSVAYNSWQHVAVTFDSTTFASGTSATWPQFYINGTNSTTSQVSTTTGAFSTNAGAAYIGDRSANDRSYSGYIDEVRLYDAVLNSAQLTHLANGRYPIGSSNYTVTLGSNFTTTSTLKVESGVLDVAGTTMTIGDTNNPIYVNNGTLRIGAGSVVASGGLSSRRLSSVAFTGSGTLQIANGKPLTINGTLSTTTGTSPTIRSVSGTYALTVNDNPSSPYAVLNIDGLTVQNMDTNGFHIGKATSTTFTKFQNINFKNGTGARLLYINGDSLALSAPGCTFDIGAGARTTTNNVVVAGTGSRYLFEDRGTATSGIGAGEAYDSDNDSTADGLADAGGSVVQWVWSSKTDLAGSIVGFPTAAFDWSNFSYYATYVAMSNIDGTTDRIYVRTANGDASYYWDVPTGVGDVIGTPRWDTIGGVHYVYVSTTGGYVYKLVDSGATLALAPNPWNTPYNQGVNATVTSPLLTDANYIYWAGNNTSGSPTLFRVSNASKGSATTQSLTATVNAALALDSPSTLAYVMAATAGHFYRYDVTNNSAPTDSTTLNPAAIDGRISVLFNKLYAVDNAGKLTVVPTTTLGTATWTYQDTGTHGSCSSGNNCQAKNIYINTDDYYATNGSGKPRVVYGDKDGHVYIVRQNGSGTTGVAMTGYPMQPNSDTSPIVTSPLYQSGILVVGNSNGKVYVINAFTATGPATPSLLQTYDFGAGVSIASISRNRTVNSNAGAYMIATSNGKLLYIPSTTDSDGFE